MDNAATTPLCRDVLEEMMPYFTERYGNASSIYATGRDARKAVSDARRRVAGAINCSPQEVFFTSGGTESDNWAIKGAAFANRGKGFGRLDPETVRQAIRGDTILISVMAANNEIGTIQPVSEIGRIAAEKKILFHTDAVQAIGAIPVDVKDWDVDMLSLSAHKVHGPKGIGALYVRKGTRLDPLIHGGAQEGGRRAGTENVPAIVGLGAAVKRACDVRAETAPRITALRDTLAEGILKKIPEVRLNGDPVNRLPNNVNVSVRYIEGEALLLRLDMMGIAGSSGSACTSGSLDPSHVLLAIGLPHEIAHGSLRLTLSEDTTRAEVEEVLEVLPGIVRTLRDMSPLFEQRDFM